MLAYDPYRWRSHLFRIHGSVLPAIMPRILVTTFVAFVETAVIKLGYFHSIPALPYTIVGAVLSLLLTFRTQTGYERFWEGRRAWGAIVNRSRNLARQFVVLLPSPEERQEALMLITTFAHGARIQLRGDGRRDDVVRLLGEERSEAFERSPGVALRCLYELDRLLAKLRERKLIDSVDQARFDRDLTELTDQLGACERIKKTPIPLAYVLHIRRGLALYCGTVAIALVETLGWSTPVAVFLITYAFFGVEQIGVEIEDPFEDAPNDIDLCAITATIENDLKGFAALE